MSDQPPLVKFWTPSLVDAKAEGQMDVLRRLELLVLNAERAVQPGDTDGYAHTAAEVLRDAYEQLVTGSNAVE